MAIVQGLMLLAFGAGFLLLDWRALRSGWLPCGANGFKGRLDVHRDRHPLGFWLMFAVYGAGGLWLLALGFRILTGQAAPLPLR